MICYTLSDCVIEGVINGDLRVEYVDFLMKFASASPNCKLAIDKDKKAVKMYLSYEDPGITYWVRLMGLTPSPNWELIEIEDSVIDSDKDLFKEICANTADKTMIVDSHNGWIRRLCEDKGTLVYNGIPLSIIDKSEAKEKIFPNQCSVVTNNYYANNSVIIGDECSTGDIQIQTK
jgi:hypothetical protein